MKTGVYAITHIETGRCYIGSTRRSFSSRWCSHKALLRAGKHHSRHLQNAWNKYGEGAFAFSILMTCKPEDAVSNEQRAISEQKPAFNVTRVLDESLTFTASEETRAKQSKAKRIAAPKHLVNGEMLTLADISERYNIPKHRLIRRAMRGITGDALLGKKRVGREGEGKKYEVNGVLLDAKQISAVYGVPPATVRKRLGIGWSGDSLAAPVVPAEKRYFNHKGDRQMRRYLVYGEMLTLTEISDKYGIPKPTVCRRIKCGVTGDAIVAPPEPPSVSLKKANDMGSQRYTRFAVNGQELTPKEIAEKYGIGHNMVKRRVARGWRGDDLALPTGAKRQA